MGGQNRTAAYYEGTTTTQLLFSYTVAAGDEDTDGIAVVANSLALNNGTIRAGSANAALTHAALQANDHKVDGIAPTVTVGGETRTYVPPDRQFNVVFYFSEKVYGITDAEITATNGQAVDVKATSGNDTWPRYTRWDVIIVPAAEGPVSVTLEAGAATDAYGNENTAPGSALSVIAADPVMVEVTRTTSGFAEGGKAEFTVTRSRDNGAIPVSLSVDQTGDLLSGDVEVYPPPDPNNPGEPVTPQELTFTETPFNLSVTFAAGETSKRIAVPTEDDYRVEDDGTVTLSVPARPDQYKYIPGPAPSATADVRDNDVPASASLYWIRSFNPFAQSNLDTELEGSSIYLQVYGFRRTRGQPLQVTLSVTEVGSYLDLDGAGASGYEDLGNGKLRVTLPVDRAFENVIIPLMENDVGEADGSVTITIEPDPERSYTPSVGFSELTVPVRDNDTPSTVSISAPDSITEGGALSYTLTRTWDPGQSWEELSVDVELAQTGDYITWPAGRQPDADGSVTIPVTFAARSLTATLSLETVDDEVSEHNGSVTATILADAGASYVTGADSDHTTKLLDNDPPIISVSAVSAEVTEGTDAQFRFTRIGNTGVATRVGLYVGGLPKIMTDATEATVLASQGKTVHIYGAFVDYILEFAAGETEKTLSFTTEADNVNEGDGWFGVTIVPRLANPFGIGTGYAQVHIHDDDIPTVSISQVTLQTGAVTLEGDTWVGDMPEAQALSWVLSCAGNYEYATRHFAPSTNVMAVQMEHVQLANHPAHYTASRQAYLGLNFFNHPLAGRCDGATRTFSGGSRFVGPDGGTETFKVVPKNPAPPLVAEYREAYRLAKEAADAAGTLVTQRDIIHPSQAPWPRNLIARHCDGELRYCPQYRIGTPHTIRLNLINRDPTILIKAESTTVVEGQPARFIVERLWAQRLLNGFGSMFETVVALRASQNGQYITGALPADITFLRTETSKIIELTTVDDSAFGADGSVTIELLPDTTGADLNVAGKYTISENWLGHTPEGGRSDRATVTITDNDNKPGVSIGPALAQEGDSGSSSMTFTVTLASLAAEAVTVNYATSDGTATAGQDYTAVSNGSVTILAGETTAEFDVSVAGDETDEPNETFNVTISLPSGATAAAITGGATAAAAGTILDDDPAVVTVAPKKSPVTEGEEVVFVLTRTGVTDEELYILVDLEDPAHRRLMIAEFDAGAVTAELSVATENNDVVDYPSERDYTIQLYGDGHFLGRDDERYTPGDPGEATVTVQDDDTLVVVTVEPVTELVGTGGSVQFRFQRTGSTAEAFTISFQGFEHPSSGDATLADASGTFLAGNDTVVYTNDVTSSGTVNPSARAHTVLIYGDAGRGGLHRSWIAGTPNRATVVVGENNSITYFAMTASYPGRMAAGESVSVEYTVTNSGTVPLPGVAHDWDGTKITTSPVRGSCDIKDDIPVGESRTCSASFTATNQDETNGKIEFTATARNGTRSATVHVYIKVAQPVEFGFTTADTLEVTEGPDVTATLPVTRTGRLNEAATVAYRLRKHGTRPASLGEDFTDPSSTPGLLTFPANVTSANIVINITQDQIDEERERFRVDLVPLADGTITEGKNSRVVLIKDEHQENDPYRPTASLLLVSSGPVPENEGPVEFAVVLDRVWGREGRYEVELLDDQLTASAGVAPLGIKGDFEDPGVLVVRIPAGQTRSEFSIPLYDDDVREEDETFQLRLGSSIDESFKTIGTSNKALATIADDDRIPPTEVTLSLSHNGSALESVPEGSTQQDITVTASFPQIRWPGDASNAPLRPADPRDVDTTVRVQFDPNSGATHAAGLDDFAPLMVEDDQGAFQEVESFDIAIPAGKTSGATTLRFKPVNDDVDEEDETVTLQGSEMVAGGSENSLPVRSTSFTITDDDARGITVSPASTLVALSLVEGGEAGTYSLVLDSQPTDTVVITLAGNQGAFLRIVPDSITFTTSDWDTPQTVSVMALDDGIAGGVRPQEWVTHQVSGGDYGSETVPNISATVEDTTEASVYLEGGKASESDGHVEFTVTVRPILRTTPVLVRYSTVDGAAIAGSDYTREVETGQTYKTLTIPGGGSSATIRIPITDDQVYESADETFTLQLTNHNNRATLDGGATSLTAIGAITDDDPKPVVNVSGPAGELSYVSETVKDPVTFTLTLMGQSAGDVTVDYATGEAGLLGLLTSRQGPAGATEDEDYAGASGSVTFTSGQTTKTVTVQVTDDDVSEETEFFGFKISEPQGADLRGQRSEVVADVGLVDDDARGATIDPTSISLDEPASGETAVTDAYTVNLKSKPTDTVTVTIGGGDPAVSLSGDTLTNNRLTFTTTNWNTAQTITVTPVKDDNAVGETVTLTHTLSGGDYAGIAADSVTINLTDSDTRNVVLSRPSLTVTEGDAAGMTYTVKLATRPSASVTVSITGHSGTDLTLSSTTLTFTVDEWDDAQTVTVTAEEDDDGVTDAVATLTHTASGGDYANVTRDLPVTVTENDTAGLVISKDNLTVGEGDAAGMTYTVVLATRPSDSVSVSITGHDGTDLTLSGPTLNSDTLTFTVDDWDTAQTMTVRAGQDDGSADSATLTHTASGGDYAGVARDLPVAVTDDDSAGIVLSAPELTVAEGDAVGSSYTVALTTKSSGSVSVSITGHSGTDLGLSGSTLNSDTLTFTVNDWDTGQTVTVRAGQDDDGANDDATLRHTASGGDYANLTKDLPVAVTDDDSAGIVLSAPELTVAEGDAVGSSYTVALTTRPSAGVSVSITGHSGTDLSLDKATLTFAAEDWATGQTVTVTAAEDDDGAADSATLTHTASGGDYASVARDLTVTVTENDTAGVAIEPTALSVVAGRSNEYTVRLATEPTGEVTVTVSGHASTDVMLDKTELTFTRGNWDDTQTVTVSAARGAATGRVTLAHAVSGADYVTVDAEAVVVSVVAVAGQRPTIQVGVTSLPQTLTVPEGGSNSYALVLGSRPTGDVSVSITGHSGTDLSLSGSTLSADMLTFTVDDWDTAQTVTVTAAEDDDGVTDAVATLTHAISGGGHGSTTLPDVEVSITENDTAGIVLSEMDLTVTEGDAVGSSYTVKLATKPSGSVSVSITGHSGTDLGLSGSTLNSDTLTFTVNDWDTAQTVTVRAGQDDDGSADSATLTHTASGGDYAGVARDLPVAVTDDDPQVTVQFGADTYTVSEGNTAPITVTLSADPQSTVIIPLEATGQGGATSDDYHVPSSVTINGGEMSKTFQFMAMADDASDDGESVMIGFGTNLPSRVTKGTPEETMVSIRQMNPQLGSGVTVQFEADTYTVSEGSTATITVTLSADPQSTVVIPITATNQGGATSADYVDVPASVTFNAGKTLTSFNFMATQDDVDENCECVLLTFGALPSGVTAGPTDEAKVSIIDNATPNGPPTVPPGPFDLTAYGEDQALHVQWKTPVAEDQRAPVNSYRMRYRQMGASSWRNVSRANDGLRLWEEITGLTNRRAYEVQVAAVNRMGTGAWASVKGTPQAPYAPPPGPEGDEAFDLGRLGAYWLHPAANGSNVLKVGSCTGAKDFRVIWNGPQGNRSADEWVVHINTRGGAGEVSYSFDESSSTPDGPYFSMNGTVNFEGAGALSLSVRGRFGSVWGTWWSPPVSLYCHEPEAPTDTCDLQVQQQAVENTLAEGEPRIDGIPESGQTLSADTTGITDDDGLNDVVFHYQWLADDSEIVGATGSTYTLTSDDEGKAITVRVDFTDDASNEETLTSAPNVVTAADLELRSTTVDGGVLTLTYNEVLDNLVSVPQTAFAVNVNGDPRSVGGVGFGESNVLLFLSSAVEAGDMVTVDYTAPDDTGFIQDILGRKADSFTGQAVTNNTDLAPLTASAHDVPSSHNGQDAFTFELRFSEDPKPDFSYTTVRDHAFTVTGGSVTYVRRLEPGENLRWDITVTPSSGADVAIDLNATTDCPAEGAICTGDGMMLSGGPLLVVPGPNSSATGVPTISGTARVGRTLTASTDDIADQDGLPSVFAYQWKRYDADGNTFEAIIGHDSSTYTLAESEEGKRVKVEVTFTDSGGSDEGPLVSDAYPSSETVGAAGRVRTPPTSSNGTVSTDEDTDYVFAAADFSYLSSDGADLASVKITGLPAAGEGALAVDGAPVASADLPQTVTATELDDGMLTYAPPANANGTGYSSFTFRVNDGTEDSPEYTMTINVSPVNDPATGAPTISGTLQAGETLEADTSGIGDYDGLTNVSYSYQWIRSDGTSDDDILSATGPRYTVVDADLGMTIKVRVSFTDDEGNDEELTSAGTGAVAAAPPPPNTPATGSPTITGTAQVGDTLTAVTSRISDGDGLTSATFTYQWLADDAEINGATGSSYTLADADAGKTVKVRVSFTDDEATEESLTSEPTAAVEEAAPTEPPPAAGNLTATVNPDGSVTLTWEAPGDDSITGYQILRRRPTEGEDTLLVYVADTQSTAPTYTDTNVTAGVQHAYRVRGINAAGTGPVSNFINVTP